MSRKINSKTLSITLIVLFAIVLLTQLMDGKKDQRTFKEKIFEVDTADITSLKLYPKIIGFEEIKLVRSGNSWNIIKDEKKYPVEPLEIQNLLGQIENLHVNRLAGNSSEKWEKFELTDSLATRVEIIADGKTVGVLYVGKFGYNYETQDSFSYVRIDDSEDVWAVSGYLQTVFDQQMNTFRYKTLVNTIKSDWNKLQFTYPTDSSFTLLKDESGWLIDGEPVDSVSTENYLNGLIKLSSRNFVDEDSIALSPTPVFKLAIEGNNFMPIELKAFEADEEYLFLITSSINPTAKFSGKKGGLGLKIFKGKSEFIVKE